MHERDIGLHKENIKMRFYGLDIAQAFQKRLVIKTFMILLNNSLILGPRKNFGAKSFLAWLRKRV